MLHCRGRLLARLRYAGGRLACLPNGEGLGIRMPFRLLTRGRDSQLWELRVFHLFGDPCVRGALSGGRRVAAVTRIAIG